MEMIDIEGYSFTIIVFESSHCTLRELDGFILTLFS